MDKKGEAFLIPLNSQRYNTALQEAVKDNVKFIIDLGCNETDFLFYVSRNPQCVKFMIGIDKDKFILRRGYQTLQRFQMHSVDTTQSTPIYLKQDDITQLSDDIVNKFKNCPYVTMIEVIEHLPLESVDKAMDCILGKLQPQKVFLTTPNIEYNSVINEFYGNTRPYQFRHRDHKFEWTRKEFSEYVSKLTSKYDYDATVSGIGSIYPGEDHEKNGYASHSVVFTKKEKVQKDFEPPVTFDFMIELFSDRKYN
ncbi:hypothetical protein TVAG_390290 [Trichomonas vaginalis G3]|uniref:Small RNA 2'-O-methyltransferase n=1 Tax=Trichomonas vaginalis (strain ATCC PRA-98 / G3) TaxID=412133 RepID=A2EST3_TRIV3|nr:O-methyltransferase protein [Trichomonas vaginalis G3]EAY04259.1 hypothetical protein TVAG_390290 [Trichomonas vaginalis G3]KAI5549352.1 O-methyltransferase protein [Trichomonas vaginalis G3]|eukprot:XP_001316482.1 hypothetical protein [Trichomonas vaginalis G3]